MAAAAQQQVAAALSSQMLEAAKIVEEQLDAEINRLEHMDDDDFERIRQKRMQEMKKSMKQKDDWQHAGHGEYQEMANEKEFFAACKASKRVVCHFYRDSTERCKIVDKHMRLLAPKHVETRFICCNVDKVPFLVTRLNIRVLPTIALVLDGHTKDYIRGFDELGGVDDFATETLEWRLGVGEAINYAGDLKHRPGAPIKSTSILGRPTRSIRGKKDDTDSDEDW